MRAQHLGLIVMVHDLAEMGEQVVKNMARVGEKIGRKGGPIFGEKGSNWLEGSQ